MYDIIDIPRFPPPEADPEPIISCVDCSEPTNWTGGIFEDYPPRCDECKTEGSKTE